MTIIHARVGERLIHGQITTVWVNTVNTQRIMIVDDAAVKDQLQVGALEMAKPAGIKLSILLKRKVIEKILAGNHDEEKVFLITKDIANMAALINGGVPLQNFNIDNISQKKGSRATRKSIALTDGDAQAVRRLTDNGVAITAQMVPSEPNEAILTFIKQKWR